MVTDFDCERIVAAFIGQPVNTFTALALVLAGVVILRRPRIRWVGWGLVATGVGSFISHGPMPVWGEWAHDVSLAWLVLVVAGLGRTWERLTQLPGLALLCVLFAFAPAMADPVAVGLVVIAVAAMLWRDRSGATLGPLMLLAAGGILGRMGTTGGPWCDPDSIWQLHGLWHVAAAIAVAWWAFAWENRTSERITRP